MSSEKERLKMMPLLKFKEFNVPACDCCVNLHAFSSAVEKIMRTNNFQIFHNEFVFHD